MKGCQVEGTYLKRDSISWLVCEIFVMIGLEFKGLLEKGGARNLNMKIMRIWLVCV